MRFYHNIVLISLIPVPFYILLILSCYTYDRFITPALAPGAGVVSVLFPKLRKVLFSERISWSSFLGLSGDCLPQARFAVVGILATYTSPEASSQ